MKKYKEKLSFSNFSTHWNMQLKETFFYIEQKGYYKNVENFVFQYQIYHVPYRIIIIASNKRRICRCGAY